MLLENKGKQYVIPYELKKPNFLINAKYDATALQMKEVNLALYNIQLGNYEKKEDGLYVRISTTELKNEINNNNKYIYKKLGHSTSEIMKIQFGVFGENEFELITVINKATYKDGLLTLRLPIEVEKFLNVESGFTLLPKRSTLLLKRTYSIRLYEILKAECFYPKYFRGEKNGVFKRTMTIDELRVNLCLINLNEPDVRDAMEREGKKTKNGVGIDYSAIVAVASETFYKDWRDLNKRVLEPAVNEINSIKETNLKIEYKGIKIGRSYGKVEFTMYTSEYNAEKEIDEVEDDPNVIDAEYVDVPKARKKTKKEKEIEVQNNFEIMLQVAALIGPVGLDPVADIDMVCKVARYDLEKIKKAAEYMKTQKNIDNPPAYMRKCIEEEWYDNIPVPKKETKKKTKNRFNDFPQRDYSHEDFVELEKALHRQQREEARQLRRTNEDDDIPKWSVECEDKREE